MKSHLNWNDAQGSEVTTAHVFRKTQQSLSAKLNDSWQSVLTYLSTSSEPRVWQSQKDGKVAWNAYDPITRKSVERVSMQEIRAWLEERHYQNV